ncbi:MAG TPA: type II toxin-antitoxin system RelE/ParE family toxin [Thermomicrobiales bacterium]|nr:type II toxin-antitoxin system RelE/ParE family toxin [Thermomicrobiales bacterium]
MPADRYEIELTRSAEKDLERLKSRRDQAMRALLQLEENPVAGHTLSGNLKGARSLEFSLKGSGVYRAVYTILEDDRVCVIFIIGPHENIYDKAERRYKALRRAGMNV